MVECDAAGGAVAVGYEEVGVVCGHRLSFLSVVKLAHGQVWQASGV